MSEKTMIERIDEWLFDRKMTLENAPEKLRIDSFDVEIKPTDYAFKKSEDLAKDIEWRIQWHIRDKISERMISKIEPEMLNKLADELLNEFDFKKVIAEQMHERMRELIKRGTGY